MLRLFGAVCGLGLGIAGAVSAQPVVVVELFTSQGCSACPPADEMLAELTDDPGVIPLSLHVDYWDYIGWVDKFGQAAFTQRQKAYAQDVGSRMLYTPQFVIDGQQRVEGTQQAHVETLIREHLQAPVGPPLSLSRQGDTVQIKAPAFHLSSPLRVQLVRYEPEMTVEIERGENAGKVIEYRNIVTSWQDLGGWNGSEPLDLAVPAKGEDATVVILQEEGPGRIVTAERLD